MIKTLSQINDEVAELNKMTDEINSLGEKLDLRDIPKEFVYYIELINQLYIKNKNIEKSNNKRIDYILGEFKKEINELPPKLQDILNKYSKEPNE